MNLSKAKYYIIPAALCLAGIAAMGYYYFFTAFSSQSETQYVYIDDDDTADSVYAKLEPLASDGALTGFRTLARHYNYADRIRTGRYAVAPGENTVNIFRMFRNGHQEPIMLTIPECRTMEQMASRLSQKLMIDSTTIIHPSPIMISARKWVTTPRLSPAPSCPTPTRSTGTPVSSG